MFFCKNWDLYLENEINKFPDNLFYLTGTNVSINSGLINFDCGSAPENFDEKKFDLLKEIYSNDENNPYAILQSNINDTIDQINKKRISLLKKHHPDVLIAKGQPLEFVEKNNHYVKMINKSWEFVKKNHNK